MVIPRRHTLASWILLRRPAGAQGSYNKKVTVQSRENTILPFSYAVTGIWLSSYYNLARSLISLFPGQNEHAAKEAQQHGKPNPTVGETNNRSTSDSIRPVVPAQGLPRSPASAPEFLGRWQQREVLQRCGVTKLAQTLSEKGHTNCVFSSSHRRKLDEDAGPLLQLFSSRPSSKDIFLTVWAEPSCTFSRNTLGHPFLGVSHIKMPVPGDHRLR